ncbi:MAG: DUF3311 domain-containing protein [Terriglobales bacterium]|jgi:hypothetical protein
MSESTASSPLTALSHDGANPDVKPRVERRPGNWKWCFLLLLPYIGLLWLPFYAKAEPRLLGFPFFYWYQFAWVFVTMFLIDFVYRRTR